MASWEAISATEAGASETCKETCKKNMSTHMLMFRRGGGLRKKVLKRAGRNLPRVRVRNDALVHLSGRLVTLPPPH